MWILRYCWYQPGSIPPEAEPAAAATDHSVVPRLLLQHYPELFEHPGLRSRLIIYGLAAYARGWIIRPELWSSDELRPASSASLSDFIGGDTWLELLPA
jgi:hypothetical protein